MGEAIRIWSQPSTARNPALRDRVVQQWCDSEVLRLTMQRASQARNAGNPGPESSLGKLGFASVNQDTYELAIDLLGADGLVGFSYRAGDREPDAFVGQARPLFLRSRANSIEGGTSEIQRNIIGERVLGLPAEPRSNKDLPWSDVPRS